MDSVDNLLLNMQSSLTKEDRCNLVERFLLSKPKDEELRKFMGTETVQNSIDIKHILLRHFRAMKYRASEQKADSKNDWLGLADYLNWIPPI